MISICFANLLEEYLETARDLVKKHRGVYNTIWDYSFMFLVAIPVISLVVPVSLEFLKFLAKIFNGDASFFMAVLDVTTKAVIVLYGAYYFTLIAFLLLPVVIYGIIAILAYLERKDEDKFINRLYPTSSDDVIYGAVFGSIDRKIVLESRGNPYLTQNKVFSNEFIILDSDQNFCLINFFNKPEGDIKFSKVNLGVVKDKKYYSPYLYSASKVEIASKYHFTGKNLLLETEIYS